MICVHSILPPCLHYTNICSASQEDKNNLGQLSNDTLLSYFFTFVNCRYNLILFE
nr:MAG TPA: hypothetical protein [Caudoviricetes sp.]